MKQRLGYLSLLLALCALVCLLPAAAAAEDAAPPTHAKVRVGYSASGSMLYRDEDGHYLGYDALYLYEIARYTGWDYEFIPYTNWSQAVADVAAGRIDLLPTVLKTPEREKEMLFSLYPMASTHIGIIARPGDARYVYGDFASTDGARVGVREQTADTKAFYQWAAKNGLSFHIARYDDRGDLLAALRAGDIDLAATSYAGEAQKFPAIAEFSPQAMYFVIAPQRPQLAAQLDQAMGNILLYNSSFVSTLERIAQPTGTATACS
ncbi:MAG: transporter substrate-binding domain-containing protein [Selenomonas bovis]|nr:transporter substrate-binding domain-containing protein [Selenomonas bovis]